MTDRNTDGLVVVTGAGGFIGGHLTGELRRLGYQRVRAIDLKPIDEWYQSFPDVDNRQLDLRDRKACDEAAAGAREIYNLACDMGGMGFIETHKAECMISVLINTHMLLAARDAGAGRYFYSSSACVYAAGKQTRPDVAPLIEGDAYRRHAGGWVCGRSYSASDVPAFPRRLRLETRMRGTTTSTVRTAPTRRAREGTRRDLPKIIAAQLAGAPESRSGARRANAQLHVHRRLPVWTRTLMHMRRARADQRRQRRARHDHQMIDIVEEIAGKQFNGGTISDAAQRRCAADAAITR